MFPVLWFTGEGNQSLNEMLPQACQNGSHQKEQKQIIGKDVEKRVPLYIVDKSVNWCSHCRKKVW